MNKKLFFKYLPLCSLIIINLFSCKNFMNGSDLGNKLKEEIEYINAVPCTILFDSEGCGFSTPRAGNYTAKVNYPFEIKFEVNAEYVFKEWKAYKKNSKELTEAENVIFDDSKNPETLITVTSTEEIRIVPTCYERIKISGSPIPENGAISIPRDNEISVRFSEPPLQDSFFFNKEEISSFPETSESLINSNNQTYGYKYQEKVYFKNISITDSEGISLAQYFTEPVIKDTTLIISTNKDNLIPMSNNEDGKKINVTLSKNICNESGICMMADVTWQYWITKDTKEKLRIEFKADKGSISPLGTDSYSLGQQISLSYNETPEYKFVEWNYESDLIIIDDPKSKNTFITIRENTNRSKTSTQITPKYLPIPSCTATPLYTISGEVCDTPIVITFNQPMNKEDLESFENVYILKNDNINGINYNSYYKNPILSDDGLTLTIKPDGTSIQELFTSNPTKELCIVITNNVRTANGNFLSDFYNSNLNVSKICIREDREQNRPVFGKVVIKDPNTSKTTSEASFDEWDDDTFEMNHIKNTVSICMEGIDNESGIKNVKVTETLIRKKDGSVVEIPINNNNFTRNFPQGNTSLYTVNFDYNFYSELDGIIKLDFQLTDNAGNSSSENITRYFLKDTILDVSAIEVTNSIDSLLFGKEYSETTLNSIQESIKEFSVLIPERYIYKDKKDTPSEYSVIAKAGITENNFYTYPAVYISSFQKNNKTYYKFTFNINNLDEITSDSFALLKIIIQDTTGNENYIKTVIPQKGKIITFETLSEHSHKFYLPSIQAKQFVPEDYSNALFGTRHFYYFEDDDNNFSLIKPENPDEEYEFGEFVDDNMNCVCTYQNSWTHTHFYSFFTSYSTNPFVYPYSPSIITISGLLSEEAVTGIPEDEEPLSFPNYQYILEPCELNSNKDKITIYITDPIDSKNSYWFDYINHELNYYTDTYKNTIQKLQEPEIITPPTNPNIVCSTSEPFISYGKVTFETQKQFSEYDILYYAGRNGISRLQENYTTSENIPYSFKIEPVADTCGPTLLGDNNQNIEHDIVFDKIKIPALIDNSSKNSGFKPTKISKYKTEISVWLLTNSIDKYTPRSYGYNSIEEYISKYLKVEPIVYTIDLTSDGTETQAKEIDYYPTNKTYSINDNIYMYIKAEDKSGNSQTFLAGKFKHCLLDISNLGYTYTKLTSTNCDWADLSLSVNKTNSLQTCYCSIFSLDEYGYWDEVEEGKSMHFMTLDSNQFLLSGYNSIPLYRRTDLQTPSEKKWFKILVTGSTENTNNLNQYHTDFFAKPKYVYIDLDNRYFDFTICSYLNTPEVVSLSSSVTAVRCNAPVLVQTLISPVNFNSIEDWETYGTSIKGLIKTYDSQGYNLYQMYSECIPDGFYYCTIVYSADLGTLPEMSEVYQKKAE